MAEEVSSAKVLDEAEFVKSTTIDGDSWIVQVWYGGTTVRVFAVEWDGTWKETGVWSISDEKGRPVDQYEIEAAMKRHRDVMVEERGAL